MEVIYVSLDIGISNKKLHFYVDSNQHLETLKILSEKYGYIMDHQVLSKFEPTQIEKVIEMQVMEMLKSRNELSALSEQVQTQLKDYFTKKDKLLEASKSPIKKKIKIKEKKKKDSSDSE